LLERPSLMWVVLTLMLFWLALTYGSALWRFLFVGDEFILSYLSPIYSGIILLAGLMVLCTCLIIEEVRELSNRLRDSEEN